MQNAVFFPIFKMINCIGGGFETELNRTSVKKLFVSVS